MSTKLALYDTLKEIYFSLDNGDRRLLEEYSLSVPRYFLLKHILDNPGISLTKLSSLMLTDKSNITRLIKSVESEGLVYREQHETDGRAVSMYLTDGGARLLQDAIGAHKEFTDQRFSPLENKAQDILSSLRELKAILDAQNGS